jgi:hypothetical protein
MDLAFLVVPACYRLTLRAATRLPGERITV